MLKTSFKGYNGLYIPYLEFEKKEEGRKNILFIHDTFEKIDRYTEFGNYFFENGYNVYILELRGHGELRTELFSDFGSDGIEAVLKDISIFIKQKFVNMNYRDVILFGHGVGSLIAYSTMINSSFKNLVISSMPLEKNLTISYYLLRTAFEKRSNVKDSSLNSNFEYFNKKYKGEGKFAYLTRDITEQQKYVQDSDLGFKGSPSMYNDIFKIMKYVKYNIKKIRQDASILVLYGTDDQSIIFEKVKKYMTNINNKVRSIRILKNDGGRHDSFHELNRLKIQEQIKEWMDRLD